MASREELYQALRNADAAGDTAGAQKLASYIQSMPADAPSPAPQDPASAPVEKAGPGNWQVANNAINKGIAGAVDSVLNLPTNVLNLGKAAVGTAAGLLGKPEYMPELTPNPDLMRKAMTKPGFINEASEPQTALQRILDTGGQFVGGSVVNPASGVRQAAGNVAKSGLAGLLGGAVREGTGSDMAGMAAGMLAPVGMQVAANSARASVANAAKTNQQNATRNQTIEEGRKIGLVLPPTQTQDSFINNRLESIAGKAAIKQEAVNRNQSKTNAAVAKDLGLPPEADITEGKLDALRDKLAQPYRDVVALPTPPPDRTKGIKGSFGGQYPLIGGDKMSPEKALHDLKQTRADAQKYWREYDRTGVVAAQDKAESLSKSAEKLEDYLEKTAIAAGKPELVNKLREARKEIAKTYTVEKALNLGDASISAPALGRALDQGKPLDGNMRTVAKMALANRPFMVPASGNPTPGVSALEPIVALGGAATGGAAGAMASGLPLIRGPVRKLLLSEPYQKYMAKTGVTPSKLAQMLSNLPANTDPDAILQSMTSGRILSEQPTRLTDILGGQ